jgi:hypothetical protein
MSINPQFPCVDCIALSVCKAHLIDYYKLENGRRMLLMSDLLIKCSLLKNYYKENFGIGKYVNLEKLLIEPIMNL